MDDLKLIKKYYGEKMMHLCRDLFSTILETPGLLFQLLDNNFDHSKNLYYDIKENGKEEEFKNYIYNFIDVEKENNKAKESARELLDKAGYILYECKTEEDIQKFKKYYKYDEELCTFDGDRLNFCYVFFAVKKNVNEIKRENFNSPKRQDEYGTSVISIQFTRDKTNTLSIKNRYNSRVNNPDATFSNNLDNIIPGLTDAFNKDYGLNSTCSNNNFELDGYVIANDGKFYKYNYEINNIYYCPNNIIIDNFKVKKYDKEKYIIMDDFILDIMNKEVHLYDKRINDAFIDGFNNILKIEISKDKQNNNKKVIIDTGEKDKIVITLDKNNNIISYENNNLVVIGDNFLCRNRQLMNINLSNNKIIGDNFLCNNKNLVSINLYNNKYIGNDFICCNKNLKNVYLSNNETIGDNFLSYNKNLIIINLPNNKSIGNNFLIFNTNLKDVYLPNNKIVGDNFLCHNKELTNIDLPNNETVGGNFLYWNEKLTSINLLNNKFVRNNFLYMNIELVNINLPKNETIGDRFLCKNKELIIINLPNNKSIGNNFLYWNENLISLNLINNHNRGYGTLVNHPLLKNIIADYDNTGIVWEADTKNKRGKILHLKKYLNKE